MVGEGAYEHAWNLLTGSLLEKTEKGAINRGGGGGGDLFESFYGVSLSHNETKGANRKSELASRSGGFECEMGLSTRCSYKYTMTVYNWFMDLLIRTEQM